MEAQLSPTQWNHESRIFKIAYFLAVEEEVSNHLEFHLSRFPKHRDPSRILRHRDP